MQQDILTEDGKVLNDRYGIPGPKTDFKPFKLEPVPKGQDVHMGQDVNTYHCPFTNSAHSVRGQVDSNFNSWGSRQHVRDHSNAIHSTDLSRLTDAQLEVVESVKMNYL
jgi:hypothetical protein